MPDSALTRHRPGGSRRRAALTLVFVGVLGAAAVTGSLPHAAVGGAAAEARPGQAGLEADEVAEAAAEAQARGESGTAAAQRAVSRSGDRWGAVYDRDDYQEFEQSLDGRYTGVGLSGRRTAAGLLEVTRVRAGGPAQRGGLRPGDVISSIDGAAVTGRPVTETMAELRGDGADGKPAAGPGSEVRLVVERDGRQWTRTLRRARLSVHSVTVRDLQSGARLIRVTAFTKGSGAQVRDAVRSAPVGAGILLDLRGNEGGLVQEAVTAASAFLDGGLVATYDAGGAEHALYARPGGDTARPLVVLVDAGTMSAAEMVTGALGDRGRAVTVGSQTFGKGSIQMPSTLPDGSVAELTVGHYRTPSGRDVDGRGITPDLVAVQDVQQRAETVLGGLGGAA